MGGIVTAFTGIDDVGDPTACAPCSVIGWIGTAVPISSRNAFSRARRSAAVRGQLCGHCGIRCTPPI